jgi:hypothetical protein
MRYLNFFVGPGKGLNADIRACFTKTSGLSVYEGYMIAGISSSRPWWRAASTMALLVAGIGLAGCADMSDGMLSAFADPAKYELYDCKQLEGERKALASRAAELQGLMAKADTGVAGPVVAELAYRNELIAVRGQTKFADEFWRRNKCHDTGAPAAPTPPATDKPAHSHTHSGNAIY